MAMVIDALMQLTGLSLAMMPGLHHEELPGIISSREFAGLDFLGFLAIAFAQWTTNGPDIYSSVQAFENFIKLK